MHDAHIHRYFEEHGAGHRDAAATREKRTWAVVALTAVMMVAELAVGTWSGSLALFADGVHMATHVGAIGLTAIAYRLARHWSKHEAFTFGTGKVYSLSGYTSALALALAALWMCGEAIMRLLSPSPIHFEEALPVAVIGLVVNLASAKLLHFTEGHGHDHHGHGHGHDHAHGHGHDDHEHGHAHHEHEHEHAHTKSPAQGQTHEPRHAHKHDPNLRAAYLHVLADALTSVLAIVAIFAGRYFGITVLDPLMGIVGAAIILHWSWGLCQSAARQLLDVAPSVADTRTIREDLEAIDDVRVADLHLWELGPGERGCIVKIVTASPRSAAYYRDVIKAKVAISHLTVEVHHCEEEHP
ncbi:MAG: CDF family Co(II)/Ni(II) efflux transporter DmeF [Polyangiaceae bacterium]|nr:CDF family Co(II)/Ni(II) efflux transporter DmeF [Polyangiaceae bacterium]